LGVNWLVRPYGFANAAIRLFFKLNMGTIASLNRRIQAVDINQIIRESIDETSENAAQFNRDDLSVGLLSTSNPITPSYSHGYARKKGFTTPDLYVTGGFYRGIFAKVRGNMIEFDSIDEKAKSLEARYGKFIYGLTQDAKSAYALQILRPILNRNLCYAIGI